jgi:hypothetical protein
MRPVVLCVLVALLAPAVARAHRSTTSRVHNARHILQQTVGDTTETCGVSTMEIPIVAVDIPPTFQPVDTDGDGKPDQRVRVEHVAEFSHLIDDDPDHGPFHECKILVDKVINEPGQPDRPRSWTTVNLCTVLGHEVEHALGWLAPPGQEYVGPYGPDRHHARDPQDLMWPFELQPWPPCADGAADAR